MWLKNKDVVVLTTVATVYQVLTEFFVAACVKGCYFYLPRTGKGHGRLNLSVGALVVVYHSAGMPPEVFTYEEPQVDPGADVCLREAL